MLSWVCSQNLHSTICAFAKQEWEVHKGKPSPLESVIFHSHGKYKLTKRPIMHQSRLAEESSGTIGCQLATNHCRLSLESTANNYVSTFTTLQTSSGYDPHGISYKWTVLFYGSVLWTLHLCANCGYQAVFASGLGTRQWMTGYMIVNTHC